jgi:hypothetical protein
VARTNTLVGVDNDERPSQTATGPGIRAAIFVEGVSDQQALEALARRRRRELSAEGVSIVPMGGAHGVRRFLGVYGPGGLDVRLAGLCDAGEEPHVGHALEVGGLVADTSRPDMEQHGFYVCEPDLEAELIRALGVDSVERVLACEGDLGAFHTLQRQPAWRGRENDEQLRRFMGSGARRKIRYARLLVDALDLDRVPRPLDRVLAHV